MGDLRTTTPGDLMKRLHAVSESWGLTDSRKQASVKFGACECWALIELSPKQRSADSLQRVSRRAETPKDAMRETLESVERIIGAIK